MNEPECKDCCSKLVGVQIEQVRHDVKNVKTLLNSVIDEYEQRVRSLEDWKLVFVSKFTVYSSLALFFGSVLSQFLFAYLQYKLT